MHGENERIMNIRRQQYQEKDREVKRRLKMNKRRWVNDKAKDAEAAANLNQMGTLYRITKQLCSSKTTQYTSVRNNGDLLTQEDLVRERWKEHF